VDVAGQVEVELDDVGTKPEDVLEAGVSGTGVVDGDPHALEAKKIQRREHRPVILYSSVLGQLEDDPGTRGTRQQSSQVVSQRGTGRGVHRHEHVFGHLFEAPNTVRLICAVQLPQDRVSS
jgi:hypothetical protein